MQRWTGPARITVQGGDTLSRSRMAYLRTYAREVIGKLENQIRNGGIWSGRRYERLGDGSIVEAWAMDNFGGLTVVHATVYPIETQESLEGIPPIVFGGFAFDPTSDNNFVVSPQKPATGSPLVGYKRFATDTQVSLNIPTRLYSDSYDEQVRFGSVDWQRLEGNSEDYILSWGLGTKCRYGQAPANDGNRIYMRGRIHTIADSAYGRLMGCAITEGNEYIVAMMWDLDHTLSVIRQPFNEVASATVGTWELVDSLDYDTYDHFYNFQIVLRIQPRSIAAFSASGKKAVMLMHSQRSRFPFTYQLAQPWALVEYSEGAGFSIDYGHPGTYDFNVSFPSLVVFAFSDNQPSNATPRGNLSGDINISGQQTADIALVPAPEGAGAPIKTKIPIAYDFIGEELQELYYENGAEAGYSYSLTQVVEGGWEYIEREFQDVFGTTRYGPEDMTIDYTSTATVVGPQVVYSSPMYLNGVEVNPGYTGFSPPPQALSYQFSLSDGQLGFGRETSMSSDSVTDAYTRVIRDVIYADLRMGAIVVWERQDNYSQVVGPIVDGSGGSAILAVSTSSSILDTAQFRQFPSSNVVTNASSSSSSFVSARNPGVGAGAGFQFNFDPPVTDNTITYTAAVNMSGIFSIYRPIIPGPGVGLDRAPDVDYIHAKPYFSSFTGSSSLYAYRIDASGDTRVFRLNGGGYSSVFSSPQHLDDFLSGFFNLGVI